MPSSEGEPGGMTHSHSRGADAPPASILNPSGWHVKSRPFRGQDNSQRTLDPAEFLAPTKIPTLDYAADSLSSPASPPNSPQVSLRSWAATPFSSRRGSPCPSSCSSTERKSSAKRHWTRSAGPMAFVARAAKGLSMALCTAEDSSAINAGNADIKRP